MQFNLQKNTLRLASLLAVLWLAFAGAGCTAKAKKAYHLSRADRYYQAGQLGPAEIEYLNVLRADPADLQADTRLGFIYYDQGRLRRAAYFLGKASQLAPDNLQLRLKLGFIASAAGRDSNALAQAYFVLDKNPQDDEAPILLAQAAVQPKDAAAAEQRLQALARNGDRAVLEAALGTLILREQGATDASAVLKKAQTLDPKSSAVNTALAEAAWKQGDLKLAAAFFKAAADASPPRSPHRMLYVQFKVQSGDLAGAGAVLAEILKSAPDYLPACLKLAEVDFAEKKYDECAGLLEQALKLDPDNYDAMIHQGNLALARGHPAEAVTDIERVARLYPQMAPAHYQLGAAYLAANEPDQAVASLQRALQLDPNYFPAALMLADIQIKSGNAEPAILELERVRQKQPELVQAQLLLANAYRLRNRVADALAIYRALEAKYPKDSQLALLHGAASLQARDKAGARQAFEQALALSPGSLPAIEALVNLDLSEKEFDVANQFIARQIQQYPKATVLRLLAARSFLAQGKRDQGEAALQQVLEFDPTNQPASLSLAQSYFDAGQFEKALARLNAILSRNPGDVSALMLVGETCSASGNSKAAAAAYEKLLKLNPKFSPALNNLAYLYAETLNNLERASELAQRARQLLPRDPATADTLGWIEFKQGAYDAALALLKESAPKLSDMPEVQSHLGLAAYMAADEPTARAALQRALQGGANLPHRAECQLCLSILEVQPQTADAAARALLEKRLAQRPGDPIARNRLARIYEREGNHDQAIAAYKAILQAAPKNVDAMVNLARLYASTDIRQAYDLAKAANKLAPYDFQVSHTLGWLAFLSGDYPLAASVLQQAAQYQPNDASLLFDYAQAAYAIGRVGDAQAALQNALRLNLPAAQAAQARRMTDLISLAANPAQAAASSARIADISKAEPEDVPALMARAAASESSGDRAAAEQACEKVLARYPAFLPALRQLARLYAAEPGKLERASALAAQVHEALPDDPAAAKILGVILVERGDYTHALTLLKQSAVKAGSDPEVLYYLGTAQFHLQNRIESKASLQQALAQKLSGPLADSAHQMLQELK